MPFSSEWVLASFAPDWSSSSLRFLLWIEEFLLYYCMKILASGESCFSFQRKLSSFLLKESFCFDSFFIISRFDGIILLRHIACHHKSYELKPLMRNHRLDELVRKSGKKTLFRFRDSLNLLPGQLDDLAQNRCPVLGHKGSIDHDKVNQ